MAWFPLFTELSTCLIIGGGTVAARKAEKLLPYGPQITVAAPRICAGLRELPGVVCLEQPFAPELITEAWSCVIAASDDRSVNSAAAKRCRELRIPVNVADCREECTFLFPALVRRGPLSIGISTGGASPDGAAFLKERIADLIPEGMEQILLWLERLRPQLKSRVPESDRRHIYSELFARAMLLERPLTPEETESIIKKGDI